MQMSISFQLLSVICLTSRTNAGLPLQAQVDYDPELMQPDTRFFAKVSFLILNTKFCSDKFYTHHCLSPKIPQGEYLHLDTHLCAGMCTFMVDITLT